MKDYQKQIQFLTRLLTFSGMLNVILLALFFWWLIKESPPKPLFEMKVANRKEQLPPIAIGLSNEQVMLFFRKMPFEQLLDRLSNSQLVEHGFTQRDLALAALVAFHHFDLERALIGLPKPAQERQLVIGKNRQGKRIEITLYPGLNEEQYQAIVAFAKKERWPLTSRGLFLAIKRHPSVKELSEAFFLTPEFMSIETLLSRSEKTISKEELLKIVLQGDWKMIATFAAQQRILQDLSPARRQRFLLDYIEKGSKEAADCLIRSDGTFVARNLDDDHLLMILNMVNEKSSESEKLLLTLLSNPRSDKVWQIVAEKLYEFAGEAKPENNLYHAALSRFAPRAAAPLAPAVNKSSKPKFQSDKTYIVQEGDSLWKIARKHQTSTSKLKQHNQLQTDTLKPGTQLKIPRAFFVPVLLPEVLMSIGYMLSKCRAWARTRVKLFRAPHHSRQDAKHDIWKGA